MRLEFAILALSIFTACHLADEKSAQPEKAGLLDQLDHFSSGADNSKAPKTDLSDRLTDAIVDTTSLNGKRQWIMNCFLDENGSSSATWDTLLDLTYDGYKDYVIGYYGQSGTGFKNRVNVYIFNSKKKCYISDEHLSRLYNPTFYTERKKITWFYMANGGGEGGSLEWMNNSWIETTEFQVVNEGDHSKWKMSHQLKNNTEIKIKPYQMIPPEEILETNLHH